MFFVTNHSRTTLHLHIMKKLTTYRFPQGVCIAQAANKLDEKLTRHSPALRAMTDLTQTRAAIVGPDVSLERAKQVMINHGVRLLFVVEHAPCVEGLILASDLEGLRPAKAAHHKECKVTELVVRDLMTALDQLDVLEWSQLQGASLDDVITVMKNIGRHHCLVVEAGTAEFSTRIRGVFSSTQISRMLGESNLGIVDIAQTFAEIQTALHD